MLVPDNLQALNNRLENYIFLGDYENALKDVNRLEDLQPGKHLARRAKLYVQMGQFDRAIADIDSCLVSNPDWIYGRITRAKAHAGLNQWDKVLEDAVAVMGKSARDFPEDWVRLRGLAYAALGHTKAAIEDLEDALDKTARMIGVFQNPDYHQTISTGEEYRRQAEQYYLEDANRLEKTIEEVKQRSHHPRRRSPKAVRDRS